MRESSQSNLHSIYYWSCAAILWTYMLVSVINLYKSWYITATFVLAFTILLIKDGVLVTYGLFRSASIIIYYYCYLLITSIWAKYPDITIWNAGTEIIFAVIFILFYILSYNFKSTDIIDFFVNMVIPCIIIFLLYYITKPESIRIGGYVLFILPYIFLISAYKLYNKLSIMNIFFVISCMMMMILGMSRTPLLISGVGLLLMFLLIIKSAITRIKALIAFIIIGSIVAFSLFTIPSLSIIAAKTISRAIYQDVKIGNQVIEAEEIDLVRWAIYADAAKLYESNWLLGMGYMNFMPWFGDEYNFVNPNARDKEDVGMNLHNSFQTWGLEGGIPCLIIVAIILWNYFKILQIRIKLCTSISDKSYYKMFIILMICTLIDGLFHQIHQRPIFFILLGIVYAFKYNIKNSLVPILNENTTSHTPSF